MRAEMEAVTLGLGAARELAPEAGHIIVIRNLSSGNSKPINSANGYLSFVNIAMMRSISSWSRSSKQILYARRKNSITTPDLTLLLCAEK